MAKANKFLLVALAISCIALLAAMSASALTCPDVQKSMAPCMSYLMTPGATPSTQCCSGVKGLVTMASTTANKRIACNCLKTAAKRITRMVPGNAVKLPSSCGARIPYKISPDTNCNSIN